MTKMEAIENAVRKYMHVKFQAIPPMHSEEIARNTKFYRFH